MSGVNSINWARIIAQAVYYFYTYFLLKNEKPINFSVPTGNFGDVYAGYLSKKMGLPINKLVVATNQNDILHRAISNGKYEAETVFETISPSMDIQDASNFERLIYDLNDYDDVETKNVMTGIKEKGKYIIPKEKLDKIKKDFLSTSLNENEILNVIKETYEKYKIILDPHSAIGLGALKKVNLNGNNVVLATAHPCKFPDAINRSINIKPNLPNELIYIMNEKENYDVISNNLSKIKQYIKEKI
jgi:threonine synthase